MAMQVPQHTYSFVSNDVKLTLSVFAASALCGSTIDSPANADVMLMKYFAVRCFILGCNIIACWFLAFDSDHALEKASFLFKLSMWNLNSKSVPTRRIRNERRQFKDAVKAKSSS